MFIPTGITGLASVQLAVTNQRVLGRVRKQHLAIAINEVESVVIRRSIFGLLFGYGSLTISGGGNRVRFPGLIAPTSLKAMIDKQVEEALFGTAAAAKEEPIPPPPPKPKPAFTAPEAPPQPRRAPDPNQW